jgi:hypothetical protein
VLAVLEPSDLSLAAAAAAAATAAFAAAFAHRAAICLRSSARCWPCSALT